MSEFVQGTCEEMCPPYEVKLRTKEHLLHFFERKSGEKNVPWKVVKAFSRSAAGIKTPRQSDLRTPRALLKTVEYLLKEILMDRRKSAAFTYDFIFDRLRCVRQEIVMQNFNTRVTLNLLEPIIMFLAYSRYNLSTETIDNFDPAICNQHLQECLKKALCCYDEIDLLDTAKETLLIKSNRCFIETLYQIFNLGSYEALERSVKLPRAARDSTFCLAQQMSLEFYRKNFHKVIGLMPKLPHVLAAVASLQLPFLRRELYRIFSAAYNSKTLTVPVQWLQKLLLYSNSDIVIKDCKYYGLEVLSGELQVKFMKTSFLQEQRVASTNYESFVDDKLDKIYLPEVLLLKKL